MNCGGGATTTGLAAELRRALAWRWSLPSSVSGHWWTRWVAGVAVVMEWLGASLRTAMATVELRELGGCCWRCETTKEERGK